MCRQADEGAAAFLIADDVQNPHRLQTAETAFLPHVDFAQRKAFAPTSFWPMSVAHFGEWRGLPRVVGTHVA
jgi:hypothetical protein